ALTERLPLGGAHQLLEATAHPVVEAPFAECRHDRLPDHARRQRIRDRTFEAIADLDAHGPLLTRNDQDETVVALGVTETPGGSHLLTEVFDRRPLELHDRKESELVPRLLLVVAQTLLELSPATGRQNPGLVGDVSAQSWDDWRCPCRERSVHARHAQKERPHEVPVAGGSGRPQGTPSPPPGEPARTRRAPSLRSGTAAGPSHHLLSTPLRAGAQR